MSSTLPMIDAQSSGYREAVGRFLCSIGSDLSFDLPEAQLAFATFDGLTEVLEWNNQGQAADEIACIWLSSLRWYAGSGHSLSSSHPYSLDRPLNALLPSSAGQVADEATLRGLAEPDMQLLDRNLLKAEVGPGALLRVLPVALLPVEEDQTVAVIAAKTAALTHGSPEAIGTAATVALLARSALAFRGQTTTPLADALSYVSGWVAGFAENTALPGDGQGIAEALAGDVSSVTGQDAAGALVALTEVAEGLRYWEDSGTLPGDPQTPREVLVFTLIRAIVSLADEQENTGVKVGENALKVTELLQGQWFSELGLG